MREDSPKLLMNILLTLGLTSLLVAPIGIIAKSGLKNYQESESVLGATSENKTDSDFYNLEQIEKEIIRLQIENEELKRTLNILRNESVQEDEYEIVETETIIIQP